MSIRYIEINNEELKALVEKKGEIVEKGRKHYAKIEEMSQEATKIANERQEVVDKILKITGEELKDKELGEFEMAMTTDIKDGVVRVSIADRVAKFKESLRSQKADAIRKENGDLTIEERIENDKTEITRLIAALSHEALEGKIKKMLEVLKD